MTDGEEVNPFEVFDNRSDLYAFFYAEHGPDTLRELLATLLTMPDVKLTAESLEHDAAELHSLGLNQAAELVAEFIAEAPPASVVLCPYQPDEVHNYTNWQAAFHRRQQRLKQVLPATIARGDNRGPIRLADLPKGTPRISPCISGGFPMLRTLAFFGVLTLVGMTGTAALAAQD